MSKLESIDYFLYLVQSVKNHEDWEEMLWYSEYENETQEAYRQYEKTVKQYPEWHVRLYRIVRPGSDKELIREHTGLKN